MSHPFQYALTTNSTATAFASKIPTATEPSGSGVHDLRGMEDKKLIQLIPFGTNGDNDTFEMRLWGWNQAVSSGGTVWIPFVITEIAVILGNIAATAIAANTFMPDTITLNEGIAAGPFHGLNSTGEDTTSFLVYHLLGAQKIEFDFDLAGGQEAASMNCLWKTFDY